VVVASLRRRHAAPSRNWGGTTTRFSKPASQRCPKQGFDIGGQFANASEATIAHDIDGEVTEEAFDQIEPGGAGRDKVQVEAAGANPATL
jgi:hypothetical protein